MPPLDHKELMLQSLLLKRAPGLGRSSLDMKREGRAETGVGELLTSGFTLVALVGGGRLVLRAWGWGCCDGGGGGRAKGFGGPVAPAERGFWFAELGALGDGGGSTGPERTDCDEPAVEGAVGFEGVLLELEAAAEDR